MIAKYIERNGNYVCSNCLMRAVKGLLPYCYNCNSEMTNWEELMEQFYLFRENEERRKYNNE